MTPARHFTDDLGRELTLPSWPPQRVVSLCPSQTETLIELGVPVVGRTKFCIHPQPAVDSLPTVGGTKQVRDDAIQALRPDLIIAEKEEQTRDTVERLSEHYPVYVTDIRGLADVERSLRELGRLTGCETAADVLASQIDSLFQQLPRLQTPVRVAYLIWRKPYMAAGADTFINALLERLGFTNVFAEAAKGRYPALEADELQAAQPDVLLLSSEPYPFTEKHLAEFQRLLPASKTMLINGESFSWYGSRLLARKSDFQDLLQSL